MLDLHPGQTSTSVAGKVPARNGSTIAVSWKRDPQNEDHIQYTLSFSQPITVLGWPTAPTKWTQLAPPSQTCTRASTTVRRSSTLTMVTRSASVPTVRSTIMRWATGSASKMGGTPAAARPTGARQNGCDGAGALRQGSGLYGDAYVRGCSD